MEKVSQKWRTKPFLRFIEYVKETEKVLRLTAIGIEMLCWTAGLVQKKARLESSGDELSAEARDKIAQARNDERLAQAQLDRGFPLVHAHALVGVWGALEVMIDDLLLAWLLNQPSALSSDVLGKIRVPLAKFETLDRKSRMLFLLDEYTRDVGSRHHPGIAGFERLLDPFGLSGPVDDDVKRTLIEMKEVRNILVHKSGIADRRFMDVCPWTDFKVGEKVEISRADYRRFTDAVSAYALSVINRVLGKLKHESQESHDGGPGSTGNGQGDEQPPASPSFDHLG